MTSQFTVYDITIDLTRVFGNSSFLTRVFRASPDCTYTTPDEDAVIIAALLTTHTTTHAATNTWNTDHIVKIEVVQHPNPTVSLTGTSKDWKYFQTCWHIYKTATKVTRKDALPQLECCDEQLRSYAVICWLARWQKDEKNSKYSASRLLYRHQANAVRRAKDEPKKHSEQTSWKWQSSNSLGLKPTNTKSHLSCFHHTCVNCHHLHHFDHVCRSKVIKQKEKLRQKKT